MDNHEISRHTGWEMLNFSLYSDWTILVQILYIGKISNSKKKNS